MARLVILIAALSAFSSAKAPGQDIWNSTSELSSADLFGENPQPHVLPQAGIDWLKNDPPAISLDFNSFIVRGQDSGGSSGGGAGAGAATDPSVPLTQMQFQNVFVPESYNSSGYSNQFILQPVIPLTISEHGPIPYHIIRPTLPILAPTPDPDGSAGVEGGLGDLTLLDVYVRPIERLKTNVGVGYVAILPTATHPQLGLREWHLGPTLFAVSKAISNWNLGMLYEQPFSMQSDAFKAQAQVIAVRTLPNEWYVGWGDQLWTLVDQNGDYNLPLSGRIGKVVEVGKQKLNIFLQPSYTPEGLHRGAGGDKWNIKLNVTFLFPEAELFDPILSRLGCRECCCR